MSLRDRRDSWYEAHPVYASIVVGVGWALVVGGVTAAVDHPSNVTLHMAVWLVGGVCFFGPGMVWMVRRNRQESADKPPKS